MSHNTDDLRVRRTQKLLREALITLIEERRFDTLTVGEITERAMVSRAAFYRHYKDKYDLVEKIFEEAVDTVRREMDLRGKTAALHQTPEGWISLLDQEVQAERTPEPFVRLFEHFAAYERLYRALLGEKGSPWFQARMRASLANIFHERATQGLASFAEGRSFSRSQIVAPEVVFTLLAGMFIDTIIWWLEHDRPSSPRSMATFCFRLLLANLREVIRWK